MVRGFKITSFIYPNIVEIQFYGQYFNTTTDALGATWAGRSILVRHGYWIPLLRTGFKQNDRPFRLRKTQRGYLIEGSYCSHNPPMSIPELQECWEGEILLAEDDGGWRRFMKYMQIQFMQQKVGRFISRLIYRNQRERHGIMLEQQSSYGDVI